MIIYVNIYISFTITAFNIATPDNIFSYKCKKIIFKQQYKLKIIFMVKKILSENNLVLHVYYFFGNGQGSDKTNGKKMYKNCSKVRITLMMKRLSIL